MSSISRAVPRVTDRVVSGRLKTSSSETAVAAMPDLCSGYVPDASGGSSGGPDRAQDYGWAPGRGCASGDLLDLAVQIHQGQLDLHVGVALLDRIAQGVKLLSVDRQFLVGRIDGLGAQKDLVGAAVAVVDHHDLVDVVEVDGDVHVGPEGLAPAGEFVGQSAQRGAGQDDVVVFVMEAVAFHIGDGVIGQAIVHAGQQQDVGVAPRPGDAGRQGGQQADAAAQGDQTEGAPARQDGGVVGAAVGHDDRSVVEGDVTGNCVRPA